ncbi:hypothetical protein EBB79_08120 [Parasedimentitalea marina]|uniref:Uncharacterized protein n=1 Tax=Parasedimentitalea marina TaxID=2483033 RepID=A0A3T0N1J9_9RHOB|nr:hypothetical protein [Parasedimentitalea marina]AZV77862.1 hypothetical protein EBB79_08120 [Parasedimentitalea marina]
MTFEQQCKAMATAPMTAPERLSGLIEAVARHTRLAALRADLIDQLASVKAGSASAESIAHDLDDTVEAECLAQEKVAAWATALLNDRTLGDCERFLLNRDQFQETVAQRKRGHTRPKVGFFDLNAAKAGALRLKNKTQLGNHFGEITGAGFKSGYIARTGLLLGKFKSLFNRAFIVRGE